MIAAVMLFVRILIVLLLVRFVVRFVVSAVQGYRQAAPPGKPELEMVRDRVCDTFLPRSRALVARVNGREQHFCSAACRDRALAPPAS
jgi:uncharacterized protein